MKIFHDTCQTLLFCLSIATAYFVNSNVCYIVDSLKQNVANMKAEYYKQKRNIVYLGIFNGPKASLNNENSIKPNLFG